MNWQSVKQINRKKDGQKILRMSAKSHNNDYIIIEDPRFLLLNVFLWRAVTYGSPSIETSVEDPVLAKKNLIWDSVPWTNGDFFKMYKKF